MHTQKRSGATANLQTARRNWWSIGEWTEWVNSGELETSPALRSEAGAVQEQCVQAMLHNASSYLQVERP